MCFAAEKQQNLEFIMAEKRCNSCHELIPEEAYYCPVCGEKQEVINQEVKYQFCINCGKPISFYPDVIKVVCSCGTVNTVITNAATNEVLPSDITYSATWDDQISTSQSSNPVSDWKKPSYGFLICINILFARGIFMANNTADFTGRLLSHICFLIFSMIIFSKTRNNHGSVAANLWAIIGGAVISFIVMYVLLSTSAFEFIVKKLW